MGGVLRAYFQVELQLPHGLLPRDEVGGLAGLILALLHPDLRLIQFRETKSTNLFQLVGLDSSRHSCARVCFVCLFHVFSQVVSAERKWEKEVIMEQ
jgi:hypothetical protein